MDLVLSSVAEAVVRLVPKKGTKSEVKLKLNLSEIAKWCRKEN